MHQCLSFFCELISRPRSVTDHTMFYTTMQEYRTWEIFGWGKFWQTIQVKAIGEEEFGTYATVSILCQMHFWCICEYWRGKFGK